MSSYEEVGQTLSTAIASLGTVQRCRDGESSYSIVADDLRLVGVLPESQQAEGGHQCADGVLA